MWFSSLTISFSIGDFNWLNSFLMKFSTFLDIEIPFALQCFENSLYVSSSKLNVLSVTLPL